MNFQEKLNKSPYYLLLGVVAVAVASLVYLYGSRYWVGHQIQTAPIAADSPLLVLQEIFDASTTVGRAELDELISANRTNPGFFESHSQESLNSDSFVNNGLNLVVIPVPIPDTGECDYACQTHYQKYVYMYVGNKSNCEYPDCSNYSGRGDGEAQYVLMYSYRAADDFVSEYVTLYDNYYSLKGDAILLLNDRYGRCCDASYYIDNTILAYSASEKKTYVYSISSSDPAIGYEQQSKRWFRILDSLSRILPSTH